MAIPAARNGAKRPPDWLHKAFADLHEQILIAQLFLGV